MSEWLTGAAWGALAGSGTLAGAVLGVLVRFKHRSTARMMAVGAGILLASVSFELVVNAVAAWAARCGDCQQQASESAVPGSGLAIAIGTALDGIPEGILLGVETARSAMPQFAVVLALLLGNFPEALSASAGMKAAGRSRRYIFTTWFGAFLSVTLAAALSAAWLARVPDPLVGFLSALAAGALFSMAAETMLPEAAYEAVGFNGFVAALGFVVLLLLLSMQR